MAYGALLTRQIKFQQFPTITEKMFFNNVDTGDILLFRTANNMVGSWFTRTFT